MKRKAGRNTVTVQGDWWKKGRAKNKAPPRVRDAGKTPRLWVKMETRDSGQGEKEGKPEVHKTGRGRRGRKRKNL